MIKGFIENVFAVALGGALGSVLRYGLVSATVVWCGKGFPWGTLAVNILGSAAIGALFVLLSERSLMGESWRLFLMTGVLGGFTTFSAFSLEAMMLIEEQAYLRAAMYVGLSVMLCLMAAAGALVLTRRWF